MERKKQNHLCLQVTILYQYIDNSKKKKSQKILSELIKEFIKVAGYYIKYTR